MQGECGKGIEQYWQLGEANAGRMCSNAWGLNHARRYRQGCCKDQPQMVHCNTGLCGTASAFDCVNMMIACVSFGMDNEHISQADRTVQWCAPGMPAYRLFMPSYK